MLFVLLAFVLAVGAAKAQSNMVDNGLFTQGLQPLLLLFLEAKTTRCRVRQMLLKHYC